MNKLQTAVMPHKVLKLIPLKIIYTAGVPSIAWNPENEDVALTDNGAGDVTLTLAVASLVKLALAGAPAVELVDANAAGAVCNIDGAPTTTVIKLVTNAATDGTTETDPVALHLVLVKYVVA